MFGMVLQDTWLFLRTIRENIAYGLESAGEEAIVRAPGRRSRPFHPDPARELQHGDHEEASQPVAGQKQLLTIARLSSPNPAILHSRRGDEAASTPPPRS